MEYKVESDGTIKKVTPEERITIGVLRDRIAMAKRDKDTAQALIARANDEIALCQAAIKKAKENGALEN